MASQTTSTSSEARELSLVSNVEFRIALADTDGKLDALLNKYLPPLLLKLGSESLAVRNKVIAVCQHINSRVQTPTIKLPVAALLKQFKEQKSQLIRHFDLIYIQQGIDRLSANARIEILLPLLQGISEIGTSSDQAAVVFHLVLRLLPLLKLPPKDSTQDVQLKSRLNLSDQDTKFLSSWFEKLLIFFPANNNELTCPGLSSADYAFLNKGAPVSETWNPSSDGGLNLTETKATALRFLGSGAFTDLERLFPALVASADSNSRLADPGEEILKRLIPSLEDKDVVQRLYSLYFGSVAPDGATPARPALRIKVLIYLGRSIRATMETPNVLRLIEEGLASDTARGSQGLQASKLRSQIFTFTTWVVRMASPIDLRQIAPKIIDGLRDFIHSQGWPSPGASGRRLPATDLSLRSLAYESIGVLVPKVDFQIQDEQEAISGFELIRWLFISLSSDDSSPQIFVSIEQALGSILHSSVDSWDKAFQERLRPFLLHQMGSHGEEDGMTGFKIVRRTQYATVRFANRFLPYSDVVARWIDLMAAASGSERHPEVVEEGKKGLHPYWYRLLNPAKDKKWFTSVTDESRSSWFRFPSFSVATRFLLGSTASTGVPGLSAAGILSGPYKDALDHAIIFLRNILLWESFSESSISTDIEQDWDVKLDVLLTSDERARCAVKCYIERSDREAVLLFLASALSGLSRGAVKGLRQCEESFISICSLAPNDIVQSMVSEVVTLKNSLQSNDQELQNVAARALGILASHPAYLESDLRELVLELSSSMGTWNSAIGEAVLRIRGAILALSYILSRLAFRHVIYKAPETVISQFIGTIFDILKDARDNLLRQSAQVAIGQLGLSGVLSSTMFPKDGWRTIKDKLKLDAKAESETAIAAMGYLTLPFSKIDYKDPQFNNLLNSLYDLQEIRSPETHFAVGGALSCAAVGWASKSLVTEFDVDEELPTLEISDTVLADMCDKIISDCGASKPSLRKASSIWLLCLVKNCGHLKQMQTRLRTCQRTFTSLLTDRDEVVQETGAQGLSLVYNIGDQTLKDDLVHDLVNSFTASGSNLREGRKVNEDTELFDPGALPTGGGSSVNTYKDIMNLASEAGDPTLVYRFMSLASNNTLWTNRAAFSKLGVSTILSDSSANGYLAKNPKIYPKLFRYRFDPNPNVQRSMNTIWQALVKDPAAIIGTHFDEIMDDLLKSMMTGREWRVRQASCAAIADLIQGRLPEKYSKYMEEIFMKAFKLIDDIKETVRVAALNLCQTITNAVIRTLETSDAETKQAHIMLSSTIPFLLSTRGMESDVEEVQGFAIGALVQMIKKCPSAQLRPFVPRIMEQFLNSLSPLEPQAVNYVHLNADRYGLTGQDIDKMRMSSIRTSPMMEVIERYLIDILDETSMKEFAAKLESVLRSAVGLPTKVGCSRVLVLLSMRTVLFQPYADRFIQLLGKYVVDRNDTVSASYCTSIGYLIRLASDDRVLKTIEHAKLLYLAAEDTNQRVIAAEILHSISKLSNDRFMTFAATALPFIYISKNDTDEHVRETLEKTWQDNVGGNRAVSLYIKEITGLVSDNLDSPRWAIKHTAALGFANAIMALDSKIDLATSAYLWPVLERALSGKTWDGKEAVVEAFMKFASQAKEFWLEKPRASDIMKAIAIREAKRVNPTYRPYAITAFGGIAQARNDLNLMSDAGNIVSRVLSELDEEDDPMDTDSGSGQKNRRTTLEDTLVACVKCLLQCINPRSNTSAEAINGYVSDVQRLIHKVLDHGGRSVQITLYEELRMFFDRVAAWSSELHGEGPKLRDLQGALAGLAGELLSRGIDMSAEAIRRERAQAGVSYITLCTQAGFEINGELRGLLKTWREGERSGPVQQVLDQALAELKE